MPGALDPERHNTLDGKGWSPMLSRLLGVFALQYPVGQVWLCIITRSYHFNTTLGIMTTIIFIPFVGSCSRFLGLILQPSRLFV